MKVVLVYNPKSGGALSEAALRAKFKDHGIDIQAVVSLGDTIHEKLARFIHDKANICVAGGDGTLNVIAGLLVGSSAVFVPLPGGTLNHFAKDLGIPPDIDEALAALKHSKIYDVDVAAVNDRVFLNNSSLGLYSSSLHTRGRFEDHLGKWPAAIIASFRSFVRFRTFDVTIEGNTFRTPFVFVGNNIYKLERATATRTRLNKGVLTVFIAKTTTRRAMCKLVLGAIVGKIHQLEEFESYAAKSVTVHTTKTRISVSYDGEVGRLHPPLRYAVKHKALRVRY